MSAKKKINAYIKLQLPAGKANPSPPVGPALGQHGVNIMQFCKDFNARSAPLGDTILPVVITVYADRSFSFIMKQPPASVLVKKALGLPTQKKPGSGSKEPNKNKIGSLSMDQIRYVGEQIHAFFKEAAEQATLQREQRAGGAREETDDDE